MDSPYAIAQNIADNYCKELLAVNWRSHNLTNSSIDNLLEKPWTELKKNVSKEILKIHYEVYMCSYGVLQKALIKIESPE